MTKEKKEKRNGRLLFTGFSMGFADLIPGVSSGTIAFLYGIYEELLYAIKTVTNTVPHLLLKCKFREAIRVIPFGFLIPLGIGMVTAVVVLVNLVSFLLDSYALFVWAVFFGLVFGSAFVIRKRMHGWTVRRVLLLITGFLVTSFIVSLPALEATNSPLVTLGSGAIASMAMILPGISGSLMLVLLGQYEVVITAISSLNLVTLLAFGVGVLLGLAAFARILSITLQHHHSAVIATLIGVMLGSLAAIWPWQTNEGALQAPVFDITFIIVIVLATLGFIAVLGLEKIGIAKEHKEDIESKDFKKLQYND